MASLTLDASFWQDPHSIFARLRRLGGVHAVVLPDGQCRHMVVRHDECRAALTDSKLVSSAAADDLGDSTSRTRGARILRSMMITQDGIEHVRLRAAVRPFFESRALDRLADDARGEVRRLLSQSRRSGEMDVVADFAAPLSEWVLGRLLGVTGESRAGLLAGLDDLSGGPGRSAGELMRTVHRLLTGESRAVVEGGMIDWAARQVEIGNLTADEAIGTTVLIMYAGHITSILLISYMLLHLLQSPAVRSELTQFAAADPLRATDAVVNETLRLESPIFPGLWRRATADVELGDGTVPAGETVLVAVASANRDESRYIRPDEFAPLTRHAGHLSFGHGAHYCLGGRLAVRIAANALSEMIEAGTLDRMTIADAIWTGTERRALALRLAEH